MDSKAGDFVSEVDGNSLAVLDVLAVHIKLDAALAQVVDSAIDVVGQDSDVTMGAAARSVMAAGGPVIGVEPQFFIDEGYELDGLTQLIVTQDMTERKAKMIELGNAFIAFPGGTGTLEEITEVMSKVSLKHLDAPCILYNLNNYYDSLKALLDHMIETGLSTPARQEGIYFADNLDEIRTILKI